MSDTSTARMLGKYLEESPAPLWLSGMLQTPRENFHTSEYVEIDIERDDESIAIAIQDISAGARHNEANLYTNKRFTPPLLNEKGVITALNGLKRQPGESPFADPDVARNVGSEAFRVLRKMERKLQRTIELQAAQMFQTGQLSLVDSAGVEVYGIDFKPKATHIVTVGTVWAADGSTGAPLSDLGSLGDVVRRDGKMSPDKLTFGKVAFQRFMANSDVQANINGRRVELGRITHEQRGQGASFKGVIAIDHYEYELWMYDGFYKHPQTGVATPYIDDDKIIMTSTGARLDLTFGAIPLAREPSAEALSFLPPRISGSEQGIDISTNAWFSEDNSTFQVSAGTRPLVIPTAIDTFASLDVVP